MTCGWVPGTPACCPDCGPLPGHPPYASDARIILLDHRQRAHGDDNTAALAALRRGGRALTSAMSGERNTG